MAEAVVVGTEETMDHNARCATFQDIHHLTAVTGLNTPTNRKSIRVEIVQPAGYITLKIAGILTQERQIILQVILID